MKIINPSSSVVSLHYDCKSVMHYPKQYRTVRVTSRRDPLIPPTARMPLLLPGNGPKACETIGPIKNNYQHKRIHSTISREDIRIINRYYPINHITRPIKQIHVRSNS